MKKIFLIPLLFLAGCTSQPLDQAKTTYETTKNNVTSTTTTYIGAAQSTVNKTISDAKLVVENTKNQAISGVNNAITTTTNTLADTINGTINTQVDQRAEQIKAQTSGKLTAALPTQNCDIQLENMKKHAKNYYQNENIVVQGYYFSKSLQTCNYVARANFGSIGEIGLFDLRKNQKILAVSSLSINDLIKVSTRSCFDITRKNECENFWKIVDSYK